jgi:hypothetical protein
MLGSQSQIALGSSSTGVAHNDANGDADLDELDDLLEEFL